MSQVTWILLENILEHLTYYSKSLPVAIAEAGHKSITVAWQPGEEIPEIVVDNQKPTVLFGSHQFVKAINPRGYYLPGGLGVNDRTRASTYMSNLPLDWFLNRDGMFMTWKMFKHRARELFFEWDVNEIFCRPDSGFKSFAGQVVRYGTIDEDLKTIDELSGVMDETMILVAKCQEIKGEFRFVVADGKIVAGSEYRWDGRLDIRRDWTPECEDLARKVAEHPWQVDIAYTCDIALLEDTVRVIELNGFSCAGMYACDMNKVAKAVSDAAIKEFYGHDL